jgi:hypothetical protein
VDESVADAADTKPSTTNTTTSRRATTNRRSEEQEHKRGVSCLLGAFSRYFTSIESAF